MIARVGVAALVLSAPVLSQTNRAWQTVGAPGFSDWATICNRIAVDPSGNVYVAYQDLWPSLGARVTVKRLAGETWQAVGQPGSGSIGSAYYCNLAFDSQGALLLATRDYGLGAKAGVRRFDPASGTWSSLGGGIGSGEAHWVDLALGSDGKACVAYSDAGVGNRTTVMRYDAGAWNAVGAPGLSVTNASFQRVAVAPNGTVYAAYDDGWQPDPSGVGRASVVRYDPASGVWPYVGSPGFTPEGATNLTLTLDRTGAPWIAYYRYHTSIVVMRFDGASWVLVPGSPTGGDLPTVDSEEWRQWLSLQFDSQNRPYVSYQMFRNSRRASVRRLEGSTWVPVGDLAFTPGAADYLTMVLDAQDTPWVAYRDGAYGQRMSVMRYAPVSDGFCTGMANSLGCTSTISSSGASSLAGITPFTIRATNVVSNTPGVLVWGTQAAAVPFGGGTLCVSGLHRTSVVGSGGAGGPPSCTGVLARDFGADLASGLPGVWIGTTLYAQFWYRDPGSPGGFALSNGLRFTVGY